jgi:hypothetical protein
MTNRVFRVDQASREDKRKARATGRVNADGPSEKKRNGERGKEGRKIKGERRKEAPKERETSTVCLDARPGGRRERKHQLSA